ncbi:MAG: ABC transporter permease [Chromatiaceae bacterium]|nr:ABC transporter permease [Gammaproteobacteria bacterium]MCB1871393.1 ABC transporter permease [Gammaproteobacteria bacterium]MCB1880783.1 ABC transporter permease [Gammaproteobacteria bacterium]MCP5427771.1 ABC transporter permease [Chromatiaceae bacterium]MCP5445958.1 ABC transporter permease [Chromatiaceae bacterium]
MQNLKQHLIDTLLILAIAGPFTSLLLALVGASPADAFGHLFSGSFGSWSKFSRVLNVWIPLTLCSLGLLYAFRSGLWNIGVEGQLVLGAVGTAGVLRLGVDAASPLLVLMLALLAGALLGSLWALLAGWLKIKGGVHEIFAGLGLNFVAMGIILWLIFGPWKRPGIASMSGTEPFPRELWFPMLEGWRVSPFALALALAAIVITAWVLNHSRFGLNLKAVGHNPRAVLLYGLSPQTYLLTAIIISGALAGLAGGVQVSAIYHRLIPAISSGYGYLSLLVVMLANFRLLPIPLIALFFAALNVGSIQLPMMMQLDSSLAGVIQGACVLSALLVFGLRRLKKGADG